MKEELNQDKPQKRKIIQIATARNELTALCNDGTVWLYDFEGHWVKCEEIPKDACGEG